MRGTGVDTSRAYGRFFGARTVAVAWIAALATTFGVAQASAAVDRGTGRLGDVFATITIGGPSVTVTTAAGENAYVTFTGAEHQRVLVKSDVNLTSGAETVDLLDPDNQRIRGSGIVGNGPQFIDPPEELDFGAPDTYTIAIDPFGSASGSNTLTVYDVPPDLTGSIVPGGADVTVTTAPGQDAYLTFYAHQGELIRLTRTAATIPASIFSIRDPANTTISSNGLVGPQGVPPLEPSASAMSVSGLYTVVMNGHTDNTGSSTFRLERRAAFQPPVQTIGSCEDDYIDSKAACGTRSDPVNTLTGAFTHEETDVSVPGTGIGFVFTRWYDSSDATVGRLGPGWTDSFFASVTEEANGDVVLHSENGQRSRFYRNADGSFLGAAGAQSTLAAIQGGWELTRHDASKLRFDAQGRLSSMKDRNDKGLTLVYDGAGKLTTVTDAASRQVTFTYNGDGLLAQIAAPGSQTVGFGYTNGRLTSFTDLAGETTTYHYDAAGRLDQITDPRNNFEVRNTYGADGRVTQQLDALGNPTTFAWDPATQTATVTDARNSVWKDVYSNNVLLERIDASNGVTEFGHNVALDNTSVKAPDGQQTTMTYDARGNVLTAKAPPSLANAQKTFVYNARNDVTEVTDARSKVTTYGYDANGNHTTVVQDGQGVVTDVYNTSGQLTSSTDGADRTTTYTYDANGNLASETDELGNKTTYGYDGAGRRTSMVEPRGNVQGANPDLYRTTYTYDDAGRLLTETNPLGQVTTNVYDAAGNRTSVTDANNKTTTYTYDAANRVLTETAPDTGVTTYTYDAVGNKLTERNPNNQTTTYTYDVNNRLASVTTPLGNKTTYFYDGNGNLTKEVEPRGNAAGGNPDDYDTLYTYDAAGRVLTETDPLGNTTTYGYDAVGNRTSVTDAKNNTTSYVFDGRGRLQSVTAPGGAVTTYAYDGAGNLLSTTDSNNHVTGYGYDDANRTTSKTLPLGRVWTYAYDAAGNPTQTVDANGNSTQTAGDGTTTQTWDRAGRLTGINYSDTTPDVTFAYDGVANRTQMVDGAGTQTYTYDSVNRLKTVVRGSDTFSYNYDLAGNLVRRTYPDGTNTDYTYDADSRLATAVSGGQTTTYGYDAAGNVLTTTLPAGNGHVEERTYDRAGRLTRVRNVKGANTLVDFSYTLDAVGNPTQVVRAGSAPGTTTYTYDVRDRLTEVCFQTTCSGSGDPFIRWTYDGVGNRLTEARPSATTNYTYNAADQLTQAGATTYTYDQNGNRKTAGSTTLTYDLANRLTTHAAGTTTTTYTYDGDGVRRQASTGSQASKKTNFVWDVNYGLPQPALERDGNNALLRRYVYGRRRISMTSSGAASYYHYDNLGSVANLTSSTGATQWTWAYEPFGAVRTETKASGTQPTNFMKFTGEYLDPTALYHLRARQYDPATGVFTSTDPVPGEASAPYVGVYVYVAGRPTVLVDPSGRTSWPSSSGLTATAYAASPADADRETRTAVLPLRRGDKGVPSAFRVSLVLKRAAYRRGTDARLTAKPIRMRPGLWNFVGQATIYQDNRKLSQTRGAVSGCPLRWPPPTPTVLCNLTPSGAQFVDIEYRLRYWVVPDAFRAFIEIDARFNFSSIQDTTPKIDGGRYDGWVRTS